jgi:hypothetical protein
MKKTIMNDRSRGEENKAALTKMLPLVFFPIPFDSPLLTVQNFRINVILDLHNVRTRTYGRWLYARNDARDRGQKKKVDKFF